MLHSSPNSPLHGASSLTLSTQKCRGQNGIPWSLTQTGRHAEKSLSNGANAVNLEMGLSAEIEKKSDSYHLRMTSRTSIDIFHFLIG